MEMKAGDKIWIASKFIPFGHDEFAGASTTRDKLIKKLRKEWPYMKIEDNNTGYLVKDKVLVTIYEYEL